MRLIIGYLLLLSCLPLQAQTQEQSHKPRVYISDSQSWETSGGFGGTNDAIGGASSGGARPQTAEIIKTFGERCPQVTPNNLREKADYVVLLDHEGGKSLILRDNKVVVFNHDGDSIISKSTRSLGNAVQEACAAITADWPKSSSKLAAAVAAAPASERQIELAANQVVVSSTPTNADIELDGNFVGSTPSTIDVAPGDHVLVIKKTGYKDWQRKMKITGGAVNVIAELEKTP
jgi:hypothetical protein